MSDAPSARPALRVVLRPIGSPITIAMSGLGIASILESGLALGWVPSGQAREVGLALLAVPFILQTLACVFLYLVRDGVTAASVGVLATTWLGLALVHITSAGDAPSAAVGLLLVSAAAAIAISGSVSLANGLLPGVVFLLAALRFAVAGIDQLGGWIAWQHAAGVIGLVVAGAVMYTALAFELKTQLRRVVLPTFQWGRSEPAVEALDGRLGPIVHEPGLQRGS